MLDQRLLSSRLTMTTTDHVSTFTRMARLVAVAALAAVAGCATQTTAPKAESKPAVFYPERPDPPRVQYLTSLSSARDVAQRGGFADFVAGKEQSEDRLKRPYGATLYRGKLYVADSRAGGVAVFDLVARRFYVIEGSGAGRLKRPINVTIDSDGTKYVTDLGREEVVVFDANERYVRSYGTKGQFRPVDTLVIGNRLYVTDLQHNEVQVLDKQSGKVLQKFGTGELAQPTNLAASPEGDIYVVETGEFRVSRFTSEGKLVKRFGEVGQVHGTFVRPKGIAVDRAGRVYVGDSAFQNVQIFDRQAQVLMAFGADVLNVPAGVSIDYDNVELFRPYAAPGFDIEYVILVVSQFDPDKVDVFGFGKLRGADYPADAAAGGPAAR
jgi:DNA-binding beta-propeller fold protein YncE